MKTTMAVNEVNVLKVALATFVDHAYGSMKGVPEAQLVAMLSRDLGVSTEMALVIIHATDEIVEFQAFDII